MRLPAISLPGGTILREKTKERECWKFLDQRLISENDSCLNGQPSNAVTVQSFSVNRWLVNFYYNIPGLFSYFSLTFLWYIFHIVDTDLINRYKDKSNLLGVQQCGRCHRKCREKLFSYNIIFI